MTTPAPNDDLVRAGLEAAFKASSDYVMIVDDRMQQMLRVAIRAYLAASEPVQAERISVLERAMEGLRAAISWIEPPFVDGLTPHQELRFRVNQCVKDAARTTLTGAR